ncbi:MAG: ANTAR domain-containing protein [Gemmatimonadota bacterium]|nr:ANTAR domain-containing protein [Gemmatimonadota bacterium]
MTESGPIATQIVSLAARNVECAVPDARAVSIYIHGSEQLDHLLSMLPEGTEVPLAARRSLQDGSTLVHPVGPDAVAAARAVGAGGASVIAVVPLVEVNAAVVGWFDESPTPAQLEDLRKGAQDVGTAVTHAKQLRDALVVPPSRLVIEQAKGMVMGRHRLPADQAFSVLRAVSQESNVPVRDVASSMVDSVNRPASP